MKTMTCKELGGMCDEHVNADTSEEMIRNGMKHLELAHPEMAAMINTLPKDDPALLDWHKTFMEKWDTTPETV